MPKRKVKKKKRGGLPDLSKQDVVCPMCAESYLETTKSFTTKKFANAGMLRLKRQYTGEGGGNQWTGPPPDPTAGYGMLECPMCEAPLAPSGHLKIAEGKATIEDPQSVSISEDSEPDNPIEETVMSSLPEESETKDNILPGSELEKNYSDTPPEMAMVILCSQCEKSFKNKQALSAHMKAHKNEKQS